MPIREPVAVAAIIWRMSREMTNVWRCLWRRLDARWIACSSSSSSSSNSTVSSWTSYSKPKPRRPLPCLDLRCQYFNLSDFPITIVERWAQHVWAGISDAKATAATAVPSRAQTSAALDAQSCYRQFQNIIQYNTIQRRSEKSFPSHKAHRAALISVFLALIQTQVYIARPRIRLWG